MELAAFSGFLAATVRVATPLLLAALGECLAEAGGVINLGIEGAMLAGALAAAIGAAQGGIAFGVVLSIAAGLASAAVFSFAAIRARADQIITGTAVTLGLTGLTGVVAQGAFGVSGAGLTLPTLTPLPLPMLANIPIVGPALFRQSLLTYLAYLCIPAASWLLLRTRFGLELRASGEAPEAASAAGVRVGRVQTIAVLIGGAMAGLAGASLVLAQVGTFTERMTAGRGFIAIAIVVLGRWRPRGVALAALLFGAATAMQYVFQATGSAIPYQVFIALPYLLAIAVLAVAVGRNRGPAALGRN